MAKDTGEAETLEGLRDKIRQRLLETDEQRIKREMIQRAGQGAGQGQRLPDRAALVERHAQAIVNRAKSQLMMAGIDVEGRTSTRRRCGRSSAPTPRKRRAATILVQAIAEREGITATDADIQKRVAEIAAARQENPKKLRAELEKDQPHPRRSAARSSNRRRLIC